MDYKKGFKIEIKLIVCVTGPAWSQLTGHEEALGQESFS
jgi:hypothetical protein